MNRVWVAAAVAGLALLTYFQFPGHTWLQSDTQIYAPILENLRDPSVLRKDILVARPHVTFTLYDEAALALRSLTGLEFREVLAIEQTICRALGIWGVFLMATAAGLSAAAALLVAAIFSLGAVIPGPTVLSFEYEAIPRGFAVPLVFCGVGLASRGRYLWAGVAGAVAFLAQPPAVYPFWALLFLLALWPTKPEIMRRRIFELFPLLAAAIVLLIASRNQAGVGETQAFFTRLDPLQEKLQRMRAPYVWVSIWGSVWMPQFVALWLLSAAAYWRIRKFCTVDLRVFLVGLPLIGLLSAPVSWLLLEKMKWALIPQFQPMRALLFVTVIAGLAAAAAAAHAAMRRGYVEACGWLLLAYLIPVNAGVLAWPGWNRAATMAILATGAVLAFAASKRAQAVLAGAAALAGFFLIPWLGAVKNYPALRTAEVERLAQWARGSTPKDAVFLFPDFGRDLAPGIFRAEALRAVYVDWKGGGQVNYLKDLGQEWWRRWQHTMARPFDPALLERFRGLGVDYLVLKPKDRPAEATPVFANQSFVVIRPPG